MDNEDEVARLTRREESDKMNSPPAPSQPQKCRHGNWNALDCENCNREHRGLSPLSEMGTIPAAKTPITDSMICPSCGNQFLQQFVCVTCGAQKLHDHTLEALEKENADIKQRLLPQFQGRAERAENAKRMAEHERDEMLEKLRAEWDARIVAEAGLNAANAKIVALRAATSMPCAPSATGATEPPHYVGGFCTDREKCVARNAELKALKDGLAADPVAWTDGEDFFTDPPQTELALSTWRPLYAAPQAAPVEETAIREALKWCRGAASNDRWSEENLRHQIITRADEALERQHQIAKVKPYPV